MPPSPEGVIPLFQEATGIARECPAILCAGAVDLGLTDGSPTPLESKFGTNRFSEDRFRTVCGYEGRHE
jgi:hypothetical protein